MQLGSVLTAVRNYGNLNVQLNIVNGSGSLLSADAEAEEAALAAKGVVVRASEYI